MTSTIKILLIAATLFLTTLSLSCAGWRLRSPPRLELRTLRISPDLPGFEYQYEVCHKRLLGICTKWVMQRDTYDLTNPEVRSQLIHMGFVATVRNPPL